MSEIKKAITSSRFYRGELFGTAYFFSVGDDGEVWTFGPRRCWKALGFQSMLHGLRYDELPVAPAGLVKNLFKRS